MRVNEDFCIYKDFENDIYISFSQLRIVQKLKFMSSDIFIYLLIYFNDRENKLDKIDLLIFDAEIMVTKLNLEVNSYC